MQCNSNTDADEHIKDFLSLVLLIIQLKFVTVIGGIAGKTADVSDERVQYIFLLQHRMIK